MTCPKTFGLLRWKAGTEGAVVARSRIAASDESICRFKIAFDPNADAELRRRLLVARSRHSLGQDWRRTGGPELGAFLDYWTHNHDWKARVSALNQLPHCRTSVDGHKIHFLHFRSDRTSARPLVLVHGWTSWVECWRVAAMLAGSDPGFDVVVPALSGLGYSQSADAACSTEAADLFHSLMQALGYHRYFVAGLDVGTRIAIPMALRYGRHVIGLHMAAIGDQDLRPSLRLGAANTNSHPHVDCTSAGQIHDGLKQYSIEQHLTPWRHDCPMRLASRAFERLAWTYDYKGPMPPNLWEMLADALTIAWMTTRNQSLVRPVGNGAPSCGAPAGEAYVYVPTAIGVWPNRAEPSAEIHKGHYNLHRYTRFGVAGPFPAWQQPEPYVGDIGTFARELCG